MRHEMETRVKEYELQMIQHPQQGKQTEVGAHKKYDIVESVKMDGVEYSKVFTDDMDY